MYIPSRTTIILIAACTIAAVACTLLPLQARAADLPQKGCQSCHGTLEPIVSAQRNMMRALSDMDITRTGGCNSCHGGSPLEPTMEKAHRGGPDYGLLTKFAAHPTTRPAVDIACGTCHRDKTMSLPLSRMQMDNSTGRPALTNGLPGYQTRTKAHEAGQSYKPPACMNSCHLWPKNPDPRWAQGCVACHMPRAADGMYEGRDKALQKSMRQAHLTSSAEHTLLGSAKAVSILTGVSGIPLKGCLTCHGGGNAVGVRFAGIPVPKGFATRGQTFGAAISTAADIHYQRGLWCQDCHTGIDIHGDGLPRSQPGRQVEIECADCHGTARSFPWELPLLYQDGITLSSSPRGVTTHVLPTQLHGTPPNVEDGYLLTARGNPIGNVVRRSGKAVLYDHAGVTHPVPLLRTSKAHDANVRSHDVGKMECYLCHTAQLDKAPAGNPRSQNRMATDPDGLLAPVVRGMRYNRKQRAPARPMFPHDTRRKPAPCQNCHRPEELQFRNKR